MAEKYLSEAKSSATTTAKRSRLLVKIISQSLAVFFFIDQAFQIPSLTYKDSEGSALTVDEDGL